MDWHARYTRQAAWTAELRKYIISRTGIDSGGRVLEIGCGTGAVIQALQQELKNSGAALHLDQTAGIFGLDLNAHAIVQAREHNPVSNLTIGDAHHLPYTDSSFDFACCHFLLLWVGDPLQVLREMLRTLKPGGWLAAFAEPDYGGRIDYPQGLAELGRLQEMSLQKQGANPRMGRKLRSVFNDLELSQVECGLLGSQWQEPAFPLDMDDEWQVIKADLSDLLPPAELDRYLQMEQQSRLDGERILFVPTFYAFGQKKNK